MIRIYDKDTFELVAEEKNMLQASKRLQVSSANLHQNRLFNGVTYTRHHWIIDHQLPECRAFIKAMKLVRLLENPDHRYNVTKAIDDAYNKVYNGLI